MSEAAVGKQRALGSLLGGFAPLCPSPLPMITSLNCKTTLLVKIHIAPSVPIYVSSGKNETYIFPVELIRIASWRGSSNGSVRYAENFTLVLLLCLIRLSDACSRSSFQSFLGIVCEKANLSLQKQEEELAWKSCMLDYQQVEMKKALPWSDVAV